MISKDREYLAFEMRAKDDEKMIVEGYAAVFNQETVLYSYDGIDYKESISPSAFEAAEMSDVVMNYNHQGKPTARTKNKTLELLIDSIGLKICAKLSGTEEGRRLYEEIKGGYIDKMSFAFTVLEDAYERETHTRRILRIKRLYDVAAVDIPAYDQTMHCSKVLLIRGGGKRTCGGTKNRATKETTEIIIGGLKMEIKDMCLADIEARKSEITTEMEKDGADLDALTEEVRKLNERKSEIEKREKLRKDIASGIIGEKSPLGRGKPEEHEERVYNAESPEYRTAFFKNLLGKNEEMTKEERAAFVHTTGNTTSPLPTTTLNRIWDLVSTEHHIMEDISIYRTGTSIDVIKHTAITQGKAKKVTENTANDDEQNTFAKVTLSGNDFSKHIDISYAMQRMKY